MECVEYLEKLKELKSEWKDEIPPTIINSPSYLDNDQKPPKYKCRKGWFQIVWGYMYIGLRQKFFNGEIRKAYEDLLEYSKNTNLPERLTNEKDIQKVNEILTKVIDDLEKRLGESRC